MVQLMLLIMLLEIILIKLAKYSNYLKDLKLVDYKVRILNTGTEAVTRVSIESSRFKRKKLVYYWSISKHY